MKRALRLVVILTVVLVLALAARVVQNRRANRGPPRGTGVVEGVDVNVVSRIASRVTKVHVHGGDAVQAGDVLVELDCTESEAGLAEATARLRAAQANLEAAQANVKSAASNTAAAQGTISAAEAQLAVTEAQERLARIELGREETLAKVNATSPSVVDAARSRLDVAMHQLAAQRASAAATRDKAAASSTAGSAARAIVLEAASNVEVARAAIVRADVAVRECHLSTPRQGIVALRNVEPGEFVQPGSVLLTITDVSDARARFYVPNRDLSAAVPGRTVHVVADAYPDTTFLGTILSTSPRAEFTPRNVQSRSDRQRLVYGVAVRIANPQGLLRAGMPVEVIIDGDLPAASGGSS